MPPLLMPSMTSESYVIMGAIASTLARYGMLRIWPTISTSIPDLVRASSTASPRRSSARRDLSFSPIYCTFRRSSSLLGT